MCIAYRIIFNMSGITPTHPHRLPNYCQNVIIIFSYKFDVNTYTARVQSHILGKAHLKPSIYQTNKISHLKWNPEIKIIFKIIKYKHCMTPIYVLHKMERGWYTQVILCCHHFTERLSLPFYVLWIFLAILSLNYEYMYFHLLIGSSDISTCSYLKKTIQFGLKPSDQYHSCYLASQSHHSELII